MGRKGRQRGRWSRGRLSGFLALVVLCFATTAVAQQRRIAIAAGEVEVLSVRGDVRRVAPGAQLAAARPLPAGTVVKVGDRLLTGADGFAILGLPDGSTVELRPHTELELLDFTGNAKELLRIWLGKVRIKIRKLIGAPNPYQMYSPVATIGVRGTEFEIKVASDEVTTVRVFEGLVEVRDRARLGHRVLLSQGEEVTIYPLRGPESPVRFEQIVAENFSRPRQVESALLERFLAFPDPHLDLVENPVYAGWLVRPSGRFYLFPARSHSWLNPEIPALSPLGRFFDLGELFATDERRLQGVSARLSYVHPFDRWVLGGVYQFRDLRERFDYRVSRRAPAAFGGESLTQQIGSSVFAPNLSSGTDSHFATLLVARRFAGQTLAFSLEQQRSRGELSTEYQLIPNGRPLIQEFTRGPFGSNRTQFIIGYHREMERLGALAFSFRAGVLSGFTAQQFHEINGKPAPLAAFNSAGTSQQWTAQWRKRLLPGFFFSLKGDLTRLHLEEDVVRFRTSDSTRSLRYWMPAGSLGLGYIWADRAFFSLDYRYSRVRGDETRWDSHLNTVVSSQDSRRSSHAFHGWMQLRLPARFFTGAGVTAYFADERIRGHFLPDATGWRLDPWGRLRSEWEEDRVKIGVRQFHWSLGRRFRDRIFAEYQVSRVYGPQFAPWGHSLLLRFAF